MKRMMVAGALLALMAATPALAVLKVGATAPSFSTKASLGGNQFDFSLATALSKGPVVLYFYPAAFTTGCTLEAHEFADTMPQFEALGASVIGISRDKIETLDKFSVSDCRSKFPVAADTDGTITKAYDAVLAKNPAYSDRTSYVIAPDGTVIYEYTDLDYSKHVSNALDALKAWKAKH